MCVFEGEGGGGREVAGDVVPGWCCAAFRRFKLFVSHIQVGSVPVQLAGESGKLACSQPNTVLPALGTMTYTVTDRTDGGLHCSVVNSSQKGLRTPLYGVQVCFATEQRQQCNTPAAERQRLSLLPTLFRKISELLLNTSATALRLLLRSFGMRMLRT